MVIRSRFARYINPVLEALRELGGSARPGEVCDWVAQRLSISDEERAEENRSGGSRFANDVAWARFYLVRAGYLDSSSRGVWSLTERGRNVGMLSEDQIADIIREVQAQTEPGTTPPQTTAEEIEQAAAEQAEEAAPVDVPRSYRERAIEIMQSLPPQGFERLCQRLLRESGF
jgi:restriction system protein